MASISGPDSNGVYTISIYGIEYKAVKGSSTNLYYFVSKNSDGTNPGWNSTSNGYLHYLVTLPYNTPYYSNSSGTQLTGYVDVNTFNPYYLGVYADNGSSYPVAIKQQSSGQQTGSYTGWIAEAELPEQTAVATYYDDYYDSTSSWAAAVTATMRYTAAYYLRSISSTANYDFKGWATSAYSALDGTAQYSSGARYKDANFKSVDASFWGVWESTLTYKENTASPYDPTHPSSASGIPSSVKMHHTASVSVSSSDPTSTSHDFLRWNTKSDGTGYDYQPGNEIKSANHWRPNTTLYAIWKIKTYSVSYNATGGEGAPDSQTKTWGEDLTLSSTVPKRTGYEFVKWNTSPDGTGHDYQPEQTYTTNAALVLYAIWKLTTYVYVWNGTAWEKKSRAYKWDGSSWNNVDQGHRWNRETGEWETIVPSGS